MKRGRMMKTRKEAYKTMINDKFNEEEEEDEEGKR